MHRTPEDLQRALERERQELASLIDPRVSNLGLDQRKQSDRLKLELLQIARDAHALSAHPQETGCLALKTLSAAFTENLATLSAADKDFDKLADMSLALERIFVTAFAVQYMG